jgi:hypothetical protein
MQGELKPIEGDFLPIQVRLEMPFTQGIQQAEAVKGRLKQLSSQCAVGFRFNPAQSNNFCNTL